METKTQDWIVAARDGKYYILDNESLKLDGIIAHAIHSVLDDCAKANKLAKELNEGKFPSRIK